jgi:nucleoid-associated protein EbfC
MNPRELQRMQQQMIKVQQQMAQAQEKMANELAAMRIEGTAGGGAVMITLTGDQQVTSVKIDPEAFDTEDITTLEDMIKIALESALEQCIQAQQEAQQRVTNSAMGGLKLPPGLGF